MDYIHVRCPQNAAKLNQSLNPIVDIFFSGCVPEVVVPLYAVGFIYIPGKLGFVSFITVQF